MSSAVGFVQGHTCCPARVARCFRGRTCPYRKQVHGCWFRHDDEEDVEEVPLCRDVAASACSSGLVFAQIKELVSRIQGLLDQIVDVPVPKVTGEIPVFVGVWEEIVDAIQPVPQEQVFEECVQNRVLEQDCGFPRASAHGGRRGSYTTGACAESYSGADCGFPRASDHGGNRGEFAACVIPPCLRSWRKSWRGCSSWMWGSRASDHGGNGGVRAGSYAGAWYLCASVR